MARKSKKKNLNTCVICGAKFEGWGHNPWPITDKGDCCTTCNFRHVIPARIELIHANKEPIVYANDED